MTEASTPEFKVKMLVNCALPCYEQSDVEKQVHSVVRKSPSESVCKQHQGTAL